MKVLAGRLVVSTLLWVIAFHVVGVAQSRLVPILTDQTPLALSNMFGKVELSTVNQAGDFAFLGRGGTALFLRRANASEPVRIMQAGDPVPGIPNSAVSGFLNPRLDNTELLIFGVASELG